MMDKLPVTPIRDVESFANWMHKLLAHGEFTDPDLDVFEMTNESDGSYSIHIAAGGHPHFREFKVVISDPSR